MGPPDAFLAVPGDLNTQTGGYLYDRRLLEALRTLRRDVRHIELPGSFPSPPAADMDTAARHLAAVPPGCALIIDGLAFGALDPAVVADLEAPIVALVHHPLAQEHGLAPQRREDLYQSERENLALAAHVIVTSPHTAQVLATRYGVPSGRITVARPGVDPPSGPGRPVDPPLILSVGIAVPRKGHDVLLRALAQITDHPWQAVIVGAARDRPYAEEIRTLATRPELARRVRLAGSVSEEELAVLYRQASVFALATRHEGYGIVFDEAMTYGLPIVSCAVGAVPDTVAPGAGLLVPPDDPGALADALIRVLDDRAMRAAMAAASRRAGAALPDWQETAQRVTEVLDRLKTHA